MTTPSSTDIHEKIQRLEFAIRGAHERYVLTRQFQHIEAPKDAIEGVLAKAAQTLGNQTKVIVRNVFVHVTGTMEETLKKEGIPIDAINHGDKTIIEGRT